MCQCANPLGHASGRRKIAGTVGRRTGRSETRIERETGRGRIESAGGGNRDMHSFYSSLVFPFSFFLLIFGCLEGEGKPSTAAGSWPRTSQRGVEALPHAEAVASKGAAKASDQLEGRGGGGASPKRSSPRRIGHRRERTFETTRTMRRPRASQFQTASRLDG